MAIKAIALDIDGTLTNDKKVVTPRTREALMRAQQAGIRVILASGRPVQGLRKLAYELELDRCHGMLVAFNGAHVVDAETDEVLYDQPMDPADMRDLIEHLRNFDVIAWVTDGPYLYVEDAFRCDITFKGKPFNIVKYERDACDLRIREVHDLCEVCERQQDKILTAATGTYLQSVWEEMYAPFRDRLSGMFTAEFYFEFMAKGIDKAHALAGALPKLGIDASEVVAFGDGQNDAPMLRWAGTGVAMANAVEETKTVADMVTASNNEDGIAVALEQLLG
jgi:Cof subfamily protein (haloacid dehalogenase superfamily)